MDQIYNFLTKRAAKALTLARDEAIRTGQSQVGTAQLLVGLGAEGTGEAARALKLMHITVKGIRLEIERTMARGSGYGYAIPYSERACNILKFTLEERAIGQGGSWISTGKLLLGLLKEGSGCGNQVLIDSGINLHELRALVIDEIRAQPEQPYR